MKKETRSLECEIDGFAISVIAHGDRIACSAFYRQTLFSVSWDRSTITHCSLTAGLEPIEMPMPMGLMPAFWKARGLALDAA